VSSAGDVNGDGFDDLIIAGGGPGDYVIFGTDAGFGASLDLAALTPSGLRHLWVWGEEACDFGRRRER
jgi:hypothetical protein